jgi:esterase/lipase superfamily enzyme
MARWFVRVTISVLLPLMAGCAGRPHGILIPLTETVPGASRVDMMVATTRDRDGDAAEMFGGDRAPATAYAAITVSIPPDQSRKIGEIQWPTVVPGNPARDFVTLRASIIDRAAAIADLHEHVAMSPGHQVLVFVHGYNTKFKEAVFRLAQIVHDSGTTATPVLFSWPSRARILAYGYDRESANFSRDELEKLLVALAADPKIGNISILAHSMGNLLTLETLRQMAIRTGKIPPKISTVMLAAPDVDVDVFQTQIHAIGTRGPHFTLFVSQDDAALAIARRLADNMPRLGAINPQKEPYKSDLAADRISVVDLTHVQADDTFHHDKFAETDVARLIGARLAMGQKIGDDNTNLGDRIAGVTARAGDAAALAVSAPVAIFDADTREGLSDRLQPFGSGSDDPSR